MSRAIEGIRPDVDWTGRERDLGQGRAPVEGALCKLGEVRRQRDLAQGRASLEGAPSHLSEGGWPRDLRKDVHQLCDVTPVVAGADTNALDAVITTAALWIGQDRVIAATPTVDERSP